jgi:hypothetical protein
LIGAEKTAGGVTLPDKSVDTALLVKVDGLLDGLTLGSVRYFMRSVPRIAGVTVVFSFA